MQQISISEIQRNLHTLDSFDIIEVIDKKRNIIKGYFLDKKYAGLLQSLIEKIEEENQNTTPMGGSLQAYANASLVNNEAHAWKRHIEEKYKI